jgi:hypothetical protein
VSRVAPDGSFLCHTWPPGIGLVLLALHAFLARDKMRALHCAIVIVLSMFRNVTFYVVRTLSVRTGASFSSAVIPQALCPALGRLQQVLERLGTAVIWTLAGIPPWASDMEGEDDSYVFLLWPREW